MTNGILVSYRGSMWISLNIGIYSWFTVMISHILFAFQLAFSSPLASCSFSILHKTGSTFDMLTLRAGPVLQDLITQLS